MHSDENKKLCMYVAHWNIFMVNKRDLQQTKLCTYKYFNSVLY